MNFEIDFSDTQSDKFTLVRPGKYSVTIEEVTLRQAEPTTEKPNPSPYFNIRMKVDDEGEYKGRNLFTIASFSEKALGRTKALLETFGVDVAGKVGIELGDENNNGDPVVLEPNLVGEPAVATVKIEKDREGEERNRVTRLEGKTRAAASVGVAGSPARRFA